MIFYSFSQHFLIFFLFFLTINNYTSFTLIIEFSSHGFKRKGLRLRAKGLSNERIRLKVGY
ncbi:hypothetical protein HanIR_Chr12g0569841 [Helianthus annuus]|nr:hypothetical protein HanIR_Chr12g0569841 [Helianthus annuus]